MAAVRKLAGELAVMIAAAALLALLGPFGTFAMPVAARFGDWLLFALGGYVFFRPVIAGGRALAARSALPDLLAIALACALAALPTTLLVMWALAGMRVGSMSIADLAGLYPEVALIGGAVTVVQLLAQRGRAPQARSAPAPAPAEGPVDTPPPPEPPVRLAPEPCFTDRLPPGIGAELLALENEDHYVRAHTALGSALILMRMRDAVAEVGAIDGLRTHRSWWVARAAVERVARRDRAVTLRLVNGLEVPVARNEVPALRAAGWL